MNNKSTLTPEELVRFFMSKEKRADLNKTDSADETPNGLMQEDITVEPLEEEENEDTFDFLKRMLVRSSEKVTESKEELGEQLAAIKEKALANIDTIKNTQLKSKPNPFIGGPLSPLLTEAGVEQEVEKFVDPMLRDPDLLEIPTETFDETDKQTEEALTDAEIADIASSAIDDAGKAQDNQPNLDDVPTGGLGSPPDTDNLNNPQTREGISFVSTPAVDNIYDEIGAVETTTAHLGELDYENVGITLGYGIVPTSGLKYEHNGTVINLPENTEERWDTLSAAGVTRENFDPDNVITDDVVKDGIRRDKYDSDESFTKAVMREFQDRVESAAERQGVDADDIPEDAMVGLVGYSYNTGVSHDYNLMRPVYEELTKGANADMTIVQTGMLQVFTEGGIVAQGIANRRRIDYNHVAEALDKPTITHKTNVQLPNGNAGFEFEFSDQTTRTFDSGKSYATETSQDSFKDDLNVRQAVN